MDECASGWGPPRSLPWQHEHGVLLAVLSQSTGHRGHVKGVGVGGSVNVEFWCA